jgi:GGDEF domain-containing protein
MPPEEYQVISIKRFLSENPGMPAETGYRRILDMALEGLSKNVIEGDPDESAQFRESIDKLRGALEEEGAVSQAFVIEEAALQSLTEHNQRTKMFLQQPRIELQNMIFMLTETIASMAAGCDKSVRRLQNVEQQIEKAQFIGDVQQLKGQLLECLEQVRAETAQQQETRATAGRIQAELESSKQRLGTVCKELDPITALPAGSAVDHALLACLKQDRRFFATAFVVQRIQAINMRFGYELGDQVLKAFRDHLRANLPDADLLFRGRGPTIIALIDRPQPVERVRAEMKRVAESTQGRTFEIRDREVMIAIAANWTVVPVEHSTTSVIAQIDSFVASQLPTIPHDV